MNSGWAKVQVGDKLVIVHNELKSIQRPNKNSYANLSGMCVPECARVCVCVCVVS